ncbi:hypothetical protein COLO4_37581 [Corchorus olitorius]|uniref:Uncharacterized protein n=1 Tax=Corchorus olitorius TaxID=93759 RepID=A0A1R3G0Q9_9ROSI|nr:hypothetical protein COLO4_37581 [Corchorus olitorius]
MGGSEDQEGEGSPIFQGRFGSVCNERMVFGGILDGFGEFILCVRYQIGIRMRSWPTTNFDNRIFSTILR